MEVGVGVSVVCAMPHLGFKNVCRTDVWHTKTPQWSRCVPRTRFDGRCIANDDTFSDTETGSFLTVLLHAVNMTYGSNLYKVRIQGDLAGNCPGILTRFVARASYCGDPGTARGSKGRDALTLGKPWKPLLNASAEHLTAEGKFLTVRLLPVEARLWTFAWTRSS